MFSSQFLLFPVGMGMLQSYSSILGTKIVKIFILGSVLHSQRAKGKKQGVRSNMTLDTFDREWLEWHDRSMLVNFGMNPPKDIETLLKAGKVQLECLWDSRAQTTMLMCYICLMSYVLYLFNV